jgi:anti-anti-sigma factor
VADIQVHVPLPVRCVYGCAVITLPAEIDMANAPAVTDTLLALLGRGASGVVVDMSGTWFCAVAGIRAIVGACDEAQRRGTWIGVVIPHPHVRKIFTLLGADRLVPIYAALDGALARADGHAGRLPERYGNVIEGSGLGDAAGVGRS